MRSIRNLLVVASASLVLAIATVVPSAIAGSTLQPLHITKDCSGFTGDIPSFCTITGSSLEAIPVGTKVLYLGPVLTDPNFMSSKVVVKAGDGNRAHGYCMVKFPSLVGLCTFWKGTGTLSGFHASVDVTVDSTGLWHWDGTYLFD